MEKYKHPHAACKVVLVDKEVQTRLRELAKANEPNNQVLRRALGLPEVTVKRGRPIGSKTLNHHEKKIRRRKRKKRKGIKNAEQERKAQLAGSGSTGHNETTPNC